MLVHASGRRTQRILRGGTWGNSALLARAAHRHHVLPDLRNPYFGFRLCVNAVAAA